MQQVQRSQSNIMIQKPLNSPQVNIYNRHFYLRGAQHSLIQTQYQSQLKQLANKQKISVASYKILCQQLQTNLLKTFNKYCSQIAQQNQFFSYEHSSVNFTQLQNVVNQICQIKAKKQSKEQIQIQHFLSQLWLILGQYQIQSEIKVNLFYTVLRIFMDPYNLSVKQCMELLNQIPQFRNANINRQKFLQQHPDLGQETLTTQYVIKLWRKIRYSNPTFNKFNGNMPSNIQFSFQPHINEKSRTLASKSLKKYLTTHESILNRTLDPTKKNLKEQNQLSRYLQNSEANMGDEDDKYTKKLSHHDILYKRKLQRDETMLKAPSDSSFKTSQISRTARPEQIRQIINNLYSVPQKKYDTNFIKQEQQKQLQYCTFSPKINKNYNSSRSSVSPVVKGYQKQLIRLNKGRQQKQRKKQAYENLGRVKNFSKNYSKSPNHSVAPSFIDRDTPKLILQINIDGERVQKLALKGNQDPHLVSKKFVIKHGLQQQMIQVLQELVEQQLRNL